MSPDQVRADVREWVSENWDPELSLRAWRNRLVDSGWARPSWPETWWGRGLPPWADDVAHEEVVAAGAVGTPFGVGFGLAAPTLLAHGTDELKRRLLRSTLTGEVTWCQLFSEPGSGSDLAGLTTRAEQDGDEWVVDGQKVWSTSAHHADYGLLLARTDWDAPKHRGITYFVLPMRQPGIDVRSLRQMNGHASFNEIFLTDARVPGANVVGDANQGWGVARTTLAHERHFRTVAAPGRHEHEGRAAHEARAEADEYFKTYRWYPQRAGRPDLAIEIARAIGTATDPTGRQEVARLYALQHAHQWTMQRAHAAQAQGRAPGAEGSLGKLAASVVARASARVHAHLAGAGAMLAGAGAPHDTTADTRGVVAEVLVSVPAQSIAGGTDEIQRNIIGERVLGLPREPSDDRDQPFRGLLRN